MGYTSGLVCAGSPGVTTITARSAADSSKYATCTVTVRDPHAVNYVNITKDSSGKYSIILTKFNNGDFYFQAYGEEENEWGELYTLSQANIDWLNNTYNAYYRDYISQGHSNDSSIDHKIYLAKTKLINTINAGTWPVEINSDEFYGMWMHYTRFEAAYAEASQLVAQMVQTAVIIASTIYQTVVTVKSIVTLAKQSRLISAAEYSTQAIYADRIENSLSGTSYSNRIVTTAEARNTQLAQLGYTNPP